MDKMSSHGAMVEQIDLSRVSRSGFDKSHHNFLTGKLGKIIPTRVKEVYPGDRIKGTTHIVTNFEPLAAPIMANMVQKDETFFVPMSVIWNKAHRFFTGKKGFEEPMPSQTLGDIYETLASYNLINDLNAVVSTAQGDRKVFEFTSGSMQLNIVAFEQMYRTIVGNAQSLGEEWEILDLFFPYIESLHSNYVAIKELTSDNVGDYIRIEVDSDLFTLLSTFYYDMFAFWFGPSSMLDYLGVFHGLTSNFVKAMLETLVSSGDLDQYPLLRPTSQIPFNWLPVRGAYWCWYWYYRDQLLELNALDPEEEMVSSHITNREVICCLLVRQRCWFKDTFTTALDNTGNGNVVVPTTQPGNANYNTVYQHYVENIDTSLNEEQIQQAINDGSAVYKLEFGDGTTYSIPSNYLSVARSTTTEHNESIDSYLSLTLLDRARRLSSWLSKRLVLGTEYDDVVYSSFMVKLSNVKMRIPEILDQTRTQVSINVVVNNTTIPNGQIAGDKSAVAWADNGDELGDGVNYYAEEHGYLYSFMTIMPIQSYPNGIQRLYLRQNRFDYYWPEFAQMGYDAVYAAEMAGLPLGEALDNEALSVFGYQGRYYDLKSDLDEEHGRLLTDLDYLTFGRKFDYEGTSGDPIQDGLNNGYPKLNYMFVHCWPTLAPFVVDDVNADLFRSDVHFRYAWERNMPVPSEILR